MGKENRSLFTILFMINFIITAAYSVSDSFFPIIFGSTIGRGVMLSMAFVLYSVSKVIFCPLAGRLIDRHGELKVLGTSLMIYAVVSVLFLMCSGSTAIFIARIMQGAACAMFRPVIYAMIGKRTDSRKLGGISGLMDVSFYAALAAGPVFGGYILEYSGNSGVLTCLFFLCIAALSLYSLLVVKFQSIRHYAHTAMDMTPRTAGGAVFSWLLIYIFFRAWSISTVSIYLPVFMNENGFQASEIGKVIGFASAVTAASLILTGRLSDMMNRCLLLSVGGLVSALMIICMPIAHTSGTMMALACVSGLFSAVSQPAGVSLLIEHAQHGSQGQILAQFNMAMNLGFIFSPLANTVFLSMMGITSVFVTSGLFIIGAVCSFFVISMLNDKEPCADTERL